MDFLLAVCSATIHTNPCIFAKIRPILRIFDSITLIVCYDCVDTVAVSGHWLFWCGCGYCTGIERGGLAQRAVE